MGIALARAMSRFESDMRRCCGGSYDYGIEPEYEIELVVEFDTVLDERDVAAALRIDTKPAIPKNKRIDEHALEIYQDAINTVYGVISSHEFKIVSEFQSVGSYSYYITFLADRPQSDGEDDVPPVPIAFKFRISNHELRGGRDNIGVKAVFKTFRLGGELYPDPVSLCDGVDRACDAIKAGDFSKLMEL